MSLVVQGLSQEFGDGLFLVGRGLAGIGRNKDGKELPLKLGRLQHSVPKQAAGQMRGKNTSDSAQSGPLSQMRGKNTSDSAQSGPLSQMRGK
ncbi:hypothetical protein, partial [Paenibacillus jilunlii]